MARKLEYSKLALRDLDLMRRWMNQSGSGQRAIERARRIINAVRELQPDPVIWPKGELPGTRQRVVEEYTIIYSVEPDTNDRLTAGNVYILRVYGPGQDRL
ncbi:MAG: type II toxin-antitoxin system RelE/ParE family toxin [Alphaproteobacteria bacterium]